MGLQEDANLAANYMLSVKRSLDLKRQWAIWEFKALLHQQEAEETAANEKAKIIHSRKNLDTKVGCAKVVMEAKYNYRMAVKEARMIRSNQLQESETAYSEAFGENTTVRSTQSARLHREHVKLMHELEEEAIKEENKSCHDFLSACQAILLHAPQLLKENLSTFYHVLLGWLPSSLQSAPFARTPQAEDQPSATTSPRPEPKWSQWLKRQHPLPDPQGSTSMDETSSKASQEGPSSSKRRETPNWFTSLKPSHTDAFSHDSDPVKEARLCYFATHPCDWIHDNTDDLSDIFRELAEGAGLLGESIHEIQLLWDGPEELKHANYALQSLPKGLRFLRVVPTTESPKVMGLKRIHDPSALWHFVGYTYCPWCGRRGKRRELWLTIWGQPTTDEALSDQYFGCSTVMLDTLHWQGHCNCQK